MANCAFRFEMYIWSQLFSCACAAPGCRWRKRALELHSLAFLSSAQPLPPRLSLSLWTRPHSPAAPRRWPLPRRSGVPAVRTTPPGPASASPRVGGARVWTGPVSPRGAAAARWPSPPPPRSGSRVCRCPGFPWRKKRRSPTARPPESRGGARWTVAGRPFSHRQRG